MTRRGRLVTFEGGEGAGKSTQIERLAGARPTSPSEPSIRLWPGRGLVPDRQRRVAGIVTVLLRCTGSSCFRARPTGWRVGQLEPGGLEGSAGTGGDPDLRACSMVRRRGVARGAKPLASAAVEAERSRVERLLAGRGRLVLRASGTEPLVRVTVEAENLEEVEALASGLAQAVSSAAN